MIKVVIIVNTNNLLSFEKPNGIGPSRPKNENLTLSFDDAFIAVNIDPIKIIKKPIKIMIKPIVIKFNSFILPFFFLLI